MRKNWKKITYIMLLATFAFCMVGCEKKVKHKWVEVGSDPNPPKITPGVHPERGSISDAAPIVSAPILIPTGRDSNDKQQHVKYLYDMETLTAEGLDGAMKELGLITDSSLFCNLVIEDVNDAESNVSAGPGASKDAKLTKKGIARYVVLDSDLVNEGDTTKYDANTYEGLITMDDVEDCISQTFEENYQLVDCSIERVTMEEYKRLHGINE